MYLVSSLAEKKAVVDAIAAGELIKGTYDYTQIKKTYEYPASVLAAYVHVNAVKFGFNAPSRDNMKVPICPCCYFAVNTEQIYLCANTKPSDSDAGPFKLTSGSAMFFSFIKMAVIYLMIHLLLNDAYNIITNITDGRFCKYHSDACDNTFFTQLSSYNKIASENLVNALDILNLVTVIFSIVFFLFYRNLQYKIYSQVYSKNQTQDDFSILVENIPIFYTHAKTDVHGYLIFDYEGELRAIFEDKIVKWLDKIYTSENDYLNSLYLNMKFSGRSPKTYRKVTSITLCFDLREMEKVSFMRENLMDEHVSIMNLKYDSLERQAYYNSKRANSLSFIPNRIKILNECYLSLSRKFALDNSVEFNLTHFVGKAFISFEYQHYRDYFVEYCEKDSGFIKYGTTNLKVYKAVDPTDVFWFNMRVSDAKRLKAVISSYLILAMVLFFAFAALTGVQWGQDAAVESSNGVKKTISSADMIKSYCLTILLTIITNLINYGLSVLIMSLVETYKHKTRTDYYFSLIVKTVITQFLNTAIIYYVFSLLNPSPALNSNGIVIKVTSLIVISGFISIIMNFIGVPSMLKWIQNWWSYSINKDETKYSKKINLFQVQLNHAMYNPEFNFAARYSEYILQVLTASFYSYIAPIGILALIIIFSIQYWVDKLNLFYRSSSTIYLNFKLSRLTLKAFECSLLVFAIGNYLFSLYLHHYQTNYVHVASMILAFLYFLVSIFTPSTLEKSIFRLYEDIYQMNYTECMAQKKFRKVYWTSNPGTMFSREKDINRRADEDVYVDYGEDEQFATEEDLYRIEAGAFSQLGGLMDNLDGKKNQFMNQGNAMAEFWKNEDNENEQGQKSPNTWNLKPNNQLNYPPLGW